MISKSCKQFLASYLAFGVLMCSHGMADTTPSSVLTTPENKSLFDQLSEYGTLSYFGTFRGPSLANLGTPLQPSPDGSADSNSPVGLYNQLTLGYKMRKKLITGVVGQFNLFPWNDASEGSQRFQMLDTILFVSRPGLVEAGSFKLDSRFSLHLPTSKIDTLARKGLATAITATFNGHFDALNSRLTVGALMFIRGYVPGDQMVPGAPSYQIVTAPYANYQLSERLTATLWIDLVGATRRFGTGFISGLQNSDIDIEPGLSWDITKNITVNPFINIYPASFSLASTSFQMNLIARAF